MSNAPKGKPERFAMIPLRIAATCSLSARAWRVLVVILGYADAHGMAWPSLEAIGRWAGVDRRNVPTAITELVEAGFIKRGDWRTHKSGRTRAYQILTARLLREGDDITADVNHPPKTAEGMTSPVMSTDGGDDITGDVLDDITGDAQTDKRTDHRKESDHLDAREARSPLSALPGFEFSSGGRRASKQAAHQGQGRKQRGKKAGRPRARPKTDLNPAWKPSADDVAFAVSLGVTDIADQAARFVDHHRSKATTSTDFSLNWHTWCRNAQKWQAERAAKPNGGGLRRDGMIGSLKRQYAARPIFEHHGTTIDGEPAESLA